jgi:hypothetical protein
MHFKYSKSAYMTPKRFLSEKNAGFAVDFKFIEVVLKLCSSKKL